MKQHQNILIRGRDGEATRVFVNADLIPFENTTEVHSNSAGILPHSHTSSLRRLNNVPQ
jgi:hypothetical protein